MTFAQTKSLALASKAYTKRLDNNASKEKKNDKIRVVACQPSNRSTSLVDIPVCIYTVYIYTDVYAYTGETEIHDGRTTCCWGVGCWPFFIRRSWFMARAQFVLWWCARVQLFLLISMSRVPAEVLAFFVNAVVIYLFFFCFFFLGRHIGMTNFPVFGISSRMSNESVRIVKKNCGLWNK